MCYDSCKAATHGRGRIGRALQSLKTPSVSGIFSLDGRTFNHRAITMTPDKIQEHLRRQPFQPFKVFLSDGSVHEVRHPEMALITRREVIIAMPQDPKDFPERTVTCDLLHVTRIEPINGRGAGPRPKSHR
jgi:hypothetical protein